MDPKLQNNKSDCDGGLESVENKTVLDMNMIKILRLPLTLIDLLLKGYILFLNWATFKFKKVQYQSFPTVNGRLFILNKGIIKLGKSVTFNSSIGSNYVGLFKPCTLAVLNNAVLEIGDYSGSSGVSIYCSVGIKIGNYVNLGGNVSIWDTDFHPLQLEARRKDLAEEVKKAPIVIEDDVFIGANSIVLKGVIIGKGAIVGAGSIVTKSIPSMEIWAGSPAKFIRSA